MYLITIIATSIYAIIGGPSVGKTTIVNELDKAGEVTCSEAATDIILEKMAAGDKTPWAKEGFQTLILEKQLEREKEAIAQAKKLGRNHFFTDRGLLENLIYLELNDLQESAEYNEILKRLTELDAFNHYKAVFYVEPYNGTDFKADISGARHEDTAECLRRAKVVHDRYSKYFEVVIVPPHMSPKERANYVLDKIHELDRNSTIASK